MKKNFLCTDCHAVGSSKIVVRGSIFMEAILYCLFFFPGLVYSTWRLTGKQKTCRMCGSLNIIPEDSPRAKELLK
jgi:hypothetical protein